MLAMIELLLTFISPFGTFEIVLRVFISAVSIQLFLCTKNMQMQNMYIQKKNFYMILINMYFMCRSQNAEKNGTILMAPGSIKSSLNLDSSM